MEMTREFAKKMVKMANDSLMAIRKGYVSDGDEYSHEVGYIKGIIDVVEAAGYIVTRDYADENSLFVIE